MGQSVITNIIEILQSTFYIFQSICLLVMEWTKTENQNNSVVLMDQLLFKIDDLFIATCFTNCLHFLSIKLVYSFNFPISQCNIEVWDRGKLLKVARFLSLFGYFSSFNVHVIYNVPKDVIGIKVSRSVILNVGYILLKLNLWSQYFVWKISLLYLKLIFFLKFGIQLYVVKCL